MPSNVKLKLTLTTQARIASQFTRFLRTGLLAAHALLSPALSELSVALVGDAAMAKLHQQYLGIPGPTDVLTFELDYDSQGRVTAGEVVVCVPEAAQAAKANGTPLKHELLLYALHGMLHLCGFDDRTARGFERMHRAEDDLLKKIGVGPVFRPADRKGSKKWHSP
jgi:probable rRNA maturation factor